MQLAIVHYHLNPGGVTQVILNHLRSLDEALGSDRLRVALVYGGRRDGWHDEAAAALASIEVTHVVVPEIDYDDATTDESQQLARKMRGALAAQGFSAADTILHFHNHALGKNVSLPGTVGQLAADGFGMLLQIHDFAEDFRPDLYRRMSRVLDTPGSQPLAARLYPQAAHIHYAVLNGRDHHVLDAAGIDASRLHLLPNPVVSPGELPDRNTARARLADVAGAATDRELVLYPVRGIRRKNVGELVLWSALLGEQATFAITLEPQNPIEAASYVHWRKVAERLGLPCMFDVGTKFGLSFLENLAAADRLVTTSVAEGFGLVYLEAWLVGRTLIGRDLPEITKDFCDNGLNLQQLGPSLLVPVDLVDRNQLVESLRTAFNRTLTSYGRAEMSRNVCETQLNAVIEHECIDFARLPLTEQQRVIEQAAASAEVRGSILSVNAWIDSSLAPVDDALVEQNADVVRSRYSPIACGDGMLGIYRSVESADRNSEVLSPSSPDAVLDSFLDFVRFAPVRTYEPTAPPA